MLAVVARSQAKQLIDIVPDDKISFVVHYIQSLTTKPKQQKPAVNLEKKAAYEALLADTKNMSKKESSLNGTEEVADIILKKYESLN